MTDAPPDDKGPTWDVLFLAITRMACVYGVPLCGFLVAGGAAGISFDLSHHYNLWWRLGICVGAFIAAIVFMRALTSWEPRWWPILACWYRTRATVLFHAATRRFGGSTVSPLPVAPASSYQEMRDYVG